MPVQQTSLEAWEYIQRKLTYQQEIILSLLKVIGEANNMRIVQSTGFPINIVTARMNELRRKGLVILSKIDICPITHRKTMWWSSKK